MRILTCLGLLLGAALSLGGVGPASAPPARPPAPVAARTLGPRVVSLSCVVMSREKRGSGVLVMTGKCCASTAMVLTARHVVDGLAARPGVNWPLEVVTRSATGADTIRRGRVSRMSERADLALVELWDSGACLPTAPVAACEPPQPGETVWYCGTGGGLPFSLVKSIANQSGPDGLLVNGEGWYGHSGAGVFVERRGGLRLVGLLVGCHNCANPKTPAWCVPLADILKFLGES